MTLQPEPANFDTDVRRPGRRYLQKVSTPNFGQKRNKHWTKALDGLHEAYKGICAYTCLYLPSKSEGSVDHFRPKSLCPELAYEWGNFRLAQPKVNSHKGDSTDVLDPFAVEAGWFVLDFPSCLVKAGEGIPRHLPKRVKKTIDVLKLNDDDSLVQRRCDIMRAYSNGEMGLSFLRKRYPFIAAEIIRQGIDETTASALFKTLNMDVNKA